VTPRTTRRTAAARPATASRAVASLAPLDVRRGGLRLVQLHDDLARVTRPNGEVAGYVERIVDAGGERWRAKRFLPRQRRFDDVAEFWSRDDAVDVFRWS